MLRAFKNGSIKDPVARRLEEKRLQRLNRIKSTVKARGHNNARRAAMNRLNRRHLNAVTSEPNLHKRTLNKRQLRDLTNRSIKSRIYENSADEDEVEKNTQNMKPYNPNSAEAILARAKKATAETRAKEALKSKRNDEIERPDSDNQNDDSFIRDANNSFHDGNELDSSFDTLWKFHAKKNNIGVDSKNWDGESDEGDLESLSPVEKNHDSPHELSHSVGHDDALDITKDIHMNNAGVNLHKAKSLALASSPMVSDRAGSAGGASSSSSRLDDDENIAFQAAWSAATPIQLHGADAHAKGISMEGTFRDDRDEGDRSSVHSDFTAGESTSRTTNSRTSERNLIYQSKVFTRADGSSSSSASVNKSVWAPPSLMNMEKNWEQRGLPTWSSVNGGGRDTSIAHSRNGSRASSSRSSRGSSSSDMGSIQTDPLSCARRGDPKELLAALEADREETARQANGVTKLRRSHAQKNLHGTVPHYATRTKARPALLKPMLNQGTRERRLSNKKRTASAPENQGKGSWRGGGAADPHKAEERDNVLKVRRREQEAAREKARQWRKQRLRREAISGKENTNVVEDKVSSKDESNPVKRKAIISQSRDSKAISKKHAQVNGKKDNSLSSLQAEKDEAAALLAEVMNSAADKTLTNQLHTHRGDDQDSVVSTGSEAANTAILHKKELRIDPAVPRSPTAKATPIYSPKIPSVMPTVPQLNLSECEPDISDGEEEEEPFMRSPAKFELD